MQMLDAEKYRKKLLEERDRIHAEMEIVEQNIRYDAVSYTHLTLPTTPYV